MELISKMTKINLFFILVARVTLSTGQDDECNEKNLDKCGTGLLKENPEIARSGGFLHTLEHDAEHAKIPESFDSREYWPRCKDVIGRIKNQGACDNCWSYCSTMVIADRLCIASNGTDKVEFSLVEINNCCSDCVDRGADSNNRPPCRQNGYLSRAFKYSTEHGLIFETCQPFDLDRMKRVSLKCIKKCVDPKLDIKLHMHKADRPMWIYGTPDPRMIQMEIMTHGPMCGCLDGMTREFRYWAKKEVYKYNDSHTIISETAHTVRIIGWGSEDGVDYWLIANSWGTGWGFKGTAKLSRSKDENLFGIAETFFAARTKPLSDEVRRGKFQGSSALDLSSNNKTFVFTITFYFLIRYFIPN